jgi:hypothetical protein
MGRWNLDSPPTARDVLKRIAQCESEIASLRKYLAALSELTQASDSTVSPEPSNGLPTEDVWIPDMKAADTTDVVRAVLHVHGAPMDVSGILAQTRSFPNWEKTGTEKRDRDRIGSALRRGAKHFVRTQDGKWDLKSRTT